MSCEAILFVYIVADSRDFKGQIGPRQRISVTLADGNSYCVTRNEIHLEDAIVAISLRVKLTKFNTSAIKGVQLCEEPLRQCEQIFMYTAPYDNLTQGFVA